MFCADGVGVVSKLSEQPRKIMDAIVVVCAAFGLTVSEAKTETMCLRTKGMPESTTIIFRVEGAGQVYSQTKEFAYLGGNVNHNNADLSTEVDRRIRNACCSFRKYTLELYDRPSAPLELKIRMLRAEVLETVNTVRLRHVEPARVPLQHAALVGERAIAPTIQFFPIWTRLSRREVRASDDFTQEADLVAGFIRAWRIRE